ncbi:MAG: META domain-containing protein [Pseudomonadota bacterium]
MRAAFFLAFNALLSACFNDETISGYLDETVSWQLEELDGQAFTERATLTFPEKGRIAGQGPCNRFFGRQSAPYPWFEASALAASRMACPALAEEARFFEALQAMGIAEISGDVLILSDDSGRRMVFSAVR